MFVFVMNEKVSPTVDLGPGCPKKNPKHKAAADRSDTVANVHMNNFWTCEHWQHMFTLQYPVCIHNAVPGMPIAQSIQPLRVRMNERAHLPIE